MLVDMPLSLRKQNEEVITVPAYYIKMSPQILHNILRFTGCEFAQGATIILQSESCGFSFSRTVGFCITYCK